ncbi:helix-turn-helix transcriptional regulator [Rhodococcus erythropolis]|uniref:helix-turn-helix transcriptional regulator n=1 Tax=Rhodococcus erythropolis TaxID=1833 RepID=UPI0021093FF1|nr:helix-turn-helix transcriptional regulator [Rhodococcus erythropolis]MCQ4129185.1 helix-turn-helix transcriptional regulator [Rhodococcus erythropolis]
MSASRPSVGPWLRDSPALAFTARDYDDTPVAHVRQQFEIDGPTVTISAVDIAARLSISLSHLRKLLRHAGTSLSEIKTEALRDAAISGLTRGESVDDVSARLGYSEPSSFRRAFKRWTGVAPSSYRTRRPRSDKRE